MANDGGIGDNLTPATAKTRVSVCVGASWSHDKHVISGCGRDRSSGAAES